MEQNTSWPGRVRPAARWGRSRFRRAFVPVRAVGSKLLAEVWRPAHTGTTSNLRKFMTQLRCTLEPDPAQPRRLVTEPRMANDSSRTRQKAGKTRITDPAP